jgi:hypothetical protein
VLGKYWRVWLEEKGGGLECGRMDFGAISKRANRWCASVVWVGNCRMSNAQVAFEMDARGHANQMGESDRERVAPRGGGERENVRQVLDPNRNPWTLLVIIHEEVVNQYPWMAYFGGVFSGEEVSIRAMYYVPEYEYSV